MAYPISRLTTWIDGNILTAAALNAEFNNIINNMIPANINDASADVAAMQANTDPGGVGTESRATNLLGEVQRLRFVIKRMFSGDQWYSTPFRTFDGAINAQTADFADHSVTGVKLDPTANYALSDMAESQDIFSDVLADVPNLEVEITTVGRPVLLMLMNDSEVFAGYINLSSPAVNLDGQIAFTRDDVEIAKYGLLVDQHSYSGFRPVMGKSFPIASYKLLDPVPAGTYTYKLQAGCPDFSTLMTFYGTKLLAIEL